MTYKEFIQNIIDTRGQWDERIRRSYCERHHIVPKCLGGLPHSLSWEHHDNIIWLTPREHFIAHKLLAEENPANIKLVEAWRYMCVLDANKQLYEPTPEEYEEMKILYRSAGISEEHKRAISDANHKRKGKIVFSDAAKIRISKVAKDRIWINDSFKSKMIYENQLNEYLAAGWSKGRLAKDTWTGKHHSEETKRKLSDSHKNLIPWNKGKAGVQKSALAGKLAINNGTTNKYIDRSELDDYLASGWVIGGKSRKKKEEL